MLAEAEKMRAQPLIGRVRCELGRLTKDTQLIEQGLRILRDLGDREQLERFER